MSAEALPLDLPAEEKPLFKSHPLLLVLILTIASFMEVLDAGIANVALPSIAGNLAVTPEEASLVTSVYLVANAVIVPITGWLTSYFGRKRLYLACVAIFITASFLCGISTMTIRPRGSGGRRHPYPEGRRHPHWNFHA